MKPKRLTAYFVTIAVLTVVILICAITTRSRYITDSPVKTILPENIGDYRGYEVYFCQNEECMRSFPQQELTNTTVCPVCGGPLDTIPLSEHLLLPSDTGIVHRNYKSPSGRVFLVSVVVSGQERRSIHKPQRCLVAQGNEITWQKPVTVELNNGTAIKVMLMSLNENRLFFAYWFTDGRHQTASHLSRLTRIAWDGIVYNERRRWAYISIGLDNPHRSDPLPELKRFIRALYPAIMPTDPRSDS